MMVGRTAVEFHWAPGQMTIDGKEKKDEAAKKAMEKVATQRCSEQFALLANVGRTISEKS